MNVWKQQLIGELIGLARATDGNEHLISDPVTQVVAEILTADIASEEQFAAYSSKIKQAKQEMVPDCFLCANPCGRTAAYDLSALEGESGQIRQAKLAILEELENLAGSVSSPESVLKLFRGLVAIGLEGYTSAELSALFAGA